MILMVLIYIIAKKHFGSVDLKFLVSEHSYMPCDREFGIIEKRKKKKDARPWFQKSVALYGVETWTLRRSEEKRIEAFEMWLWRRMERVKWTDSIKSEAVLERVGEERIMLKLIRKRKRNSLGYGLKRNCLLKDALEGMVNGRRVRGRRRYQMIDYVKIYGSYEETKRKTENRKDWRILGLQNAYRVLVGRPAGKRPLGRPRRRWEDNIKMDLREVGYDGRDWVNLAQGGFVWLRNLDSYFEGRTEVKGVSEIFGTNRDEVTGEWRKLQNAELYALCSAPDIIRNIKSRRLRWAGHVARMGESRNAYRVLVGRPEGIRPLGRPRRRWEAGLMLLRIGTDGGLIFAICALFTVCGASMEKSSCELISHTFHRRQANKDRSADPFVVAKTSDRTLFNMITYTDYDVWIDYEIVMEGIQGLMYAKSDREEKGNETVSVSHCETWTLTSREEQRLRAFENKVLTKIFGAKRDEVTGEWRKLHDTELHALYSSPDIIRNIKSRRLRWTGHVARMSEFRNAFRMLVGRPEGKRPFGRPRRRWEDNIKMDLREVEYDGRKWINLAQDRDR
ncbi:hypothetical protein ANN_05720 [Periplaneta americana]|uniref:Uncharacterized protein n=1 Tax=Periplaneta americana TaxID=6978 RepID=A0ABQ8TCW1_PERAM|nr:hypothetical protein ANN_05720 [Periplaneta americana]